MVDTKNSPFNRFKAVRKELRYTQSEFAKLLNIPSSTADIERGKTKIPGHALAILMKSFGINPLWIFNESPDKYLSQTIDISPKIITIDPTGVENILLVNQKAQAGYSGNIQDPGYYEQLPAFRYHSPNSETPPTAVFKWQATVWNPICKPGTGSSEGLFLKLKKSSTDVCM